MEQTYVTAGNKKNASRPGRVSEHPSAGAGRHSSLWLHRALGNQAVMRLMQSGLLQTNRTISRAGGMCGQEAGRLAGRVMRTAGPAVELKPRCNTRNFSCGVKEIGEKPLEIAPLVQRTSGETGARSDLESDVNALRGGGEPLPESTRNFFEPRFGRDFSGVRVHNDSRAAETAAAVNARAYTLDNDIVFGNGEYRSDTTDGRKLIAHELTHVVQQSSGIPSLQQSPLTEEERQKDLASEKYASNTRLQKAYDNSPPLGIGETGEAVRLVQEGLAADGIALPISTNKQTGELDGIFGQETYRGVQEFQRKYAGDGLIDASGRADGIVGRNTMGKLDELARRGRTLPACPQSEPGSGKTKTGALPGRTGGVFGYAEPPANEEANACAKVPGGKQPPRVIGTSNCQPNFQCSNPDVILQKPNIAFILCGTRVTTNDGPGHITPLGCPAQWSAAPGKLRFESGTGNAAAWQLNPQMEYSTCIPGEENKWEWGFIQTVEPAIMGAYYDNNQKHYFTAVLRARDALSSGAPAPWYDAPGSPFGPQGLATSPVFADTPKLPISVQHKNSTKPGLHRVFINGIFYTWLAVKRKGAAASPQTVDFLYHWRFDVNRFWNFKNSVPNAHPCSPSEWEGGGGQQTGDEGAGQGSRSPVWDNPVANVTQKEYWLP